MNWQRTLTVARSDLRQLRQSPDFWGPMLALAAIFFIIAPAVLLFAVTHIRESSVVQRVSSTLEILPRSAQASGQTERRSGGGRLAMAWASATGLGSLRARQPHNIS